MEGGLTISKRMFVLTLIGGCVLSAVIGSGITLVAKTGPQGPKGEQGIRGPEGPEGDSAFDATIEAEEALSRVNRLEDDVEEIETSFIYGEEPASVYELQSVESNLGRVESDLSSLCRALETYC
jgi:hypothetical protein